MPMPSFPIRILLPVIKTGTGAQYYFYRLADGLRQYTTCIVDVVDFNHLYELAPWVVRKGGLVNYDIVCANSAYAFAFKGVGKKLIAIELHSIFDKAFLATCSSLQRAYYRCLIQPYIRRSLRQADHIVCISSFTETKTRQLVREEKISIIYPWIDLEKFNPSLIQDVVPVRVKNDRIHLLYVGSLSGRKGSALLPQLARQLGDRFLIYCVTKDVGKWFDSAPANLILKGKVSEEQLLSLYQQTDAVLTTSLYEGFGYTLLEGLACGKPVVAFNLEVFREVVPEDAHQYLAKVGDLDSLVECCEKLADNLGRPHIKPQSLRSYAAAKFAPQKLVNDFYDLFCDILH